MVESGTKGTISETLQLCILNNMSLTFFLEGAESISATELQDGEDAWFTSLIEENGWEYQRERFPRRYEMPSLSFTLSILEDNQNSMKWSSSCLV